LRIEPEISLIQFGALYFIRMGIKIPITQEYNDTKSFKDKRLMRGLENRVGECYTET
jgi:hypothetical protein